MLAECAQLRALALEDRLQLIGQLFLECERYELFSDAVLLAQQRMGAPERIAQEGELTLALVQETQVLVPDEDAAVNRHARGAYIVLLCARRSGRCCDDVPLRIGKLHVQARVREEGLVEAVRRHEPRAQAEFDEQQKKERRHRRQLRPAHPIHVLKADGVYDKEDEQHKGEYHRSAQDLLLLCLFEEQEECCQDLKEPERPVCIGAPREMFLPDHFLCVPYEVEELMMEIVAEDERGEQEIEPKYHFQPRRHAAAAHVLIGGPCNPEKSHREAAAEHVEEIPERALQRHVVHERENLDHAVEFPEEQHRDEQEYRAPSAVVKDPCADACAPENGDDKGEREDSEACMRCIRCENGTVQQRRMIVLVCRTDGARDDAHRAYCTVGMRRPRIARCR